MKKKKLNRKTGTVLIPWKIKPIGARLLIDPKVIKSILKTPCRFWKRSISSESSTNIINKSIDHMHPQDSCL